MNKQELLTLKMFSFTDNFTFKKSAEEYSKLVMIKIIKRQIFNSIFRVNKYKLKYELCYFEPFLNIISCFGFFFLLYAKLGFLLPELNDKKYLEIIFRGQTTL